MMMLIFGDDMLLGIMRHEPLQTLAHALKGTFMDEPTGKTGSTHTEVDPIF